MEEYLVRQYLAGFASKAKKPLHTGVRTELHDLISLSVCLSVCFVPGCVEGAIV